MALISKPMTQTAVSNHPASSSIKKNRRGISCALTHEQLESCLEETKKESEFYYALFSALAFTGAKIGQIATSRWNDFTGDAFLVRSGRISYCPERAVKDDRLTACIARWKNIQIGRHAFSEYGLLFPSPRDVTKPIARPRVDEFLRMVCGRLKIHGASTHSFRITWLQNQSPDSLVESSVYSSRSLGVLRGGTINRDSNIAASEGSENEAEPTPPPALRLDEEWGALEGAREWQYVPCVRNQCGDCVPTTDVSNGLYAVRYKSIQAYVGMSVGVRSRLANNLRHAPRMIGTLPGGSVWVLAIPRIYNLHLLEEIYIAQTKPCLNKVWDDIRYHCFPRAQSTMTAEDKRQLVSVIRRRHAELCAASS